jgi:hypothetical protein
MFVRFVIVAVLCFFACEAISQRAGKEVKDYNGPITLGGRTYTSRKEFILSGKKCGTKEPSEAKVLEVEGHLAKLYEKVHKDELAAKTTIYAEVPVHFHVVTTSTGFGGLSSTDVHEQVNVLNNAYRKHGVKFVVGGINTIQNEAWFDLGISSQEESDLKNANRVGGTNALNVYTVTNSEGILGWATFPWDVSDSQPMDGVVIDFRTLPNGDYAPYNEGVTLVHEVGHWMGLLHTFQGGCKKYKSQGDMVGDTPAVAGPNFGCPADNTNTCRGTAYGFKGNDLVHNYMDYGDDDCLDSFTKGQRQRMHQAWTAFRALQG